MDPATLAVALGGSAVVSALVTAVLGHWNELSRAREERRQARLAQTYLEVIEMVILLCDRARATHPNMSVKDGALVPEVPSLDRQRVLRARLSAYGSPAMQRAYDDVATTYGVFVALIGVYDSLPAMIASGSKGLATQIAPTAASFAATRTHLDDLASQLLDRANDELAEGRRNIVVRLGSGVWRQVGRPFVWAAALVGRERDGKPEG